MCGGVWYCCGAVVELLVLGHSACDVCSGEEHIVLVICCDTFGVVGGISVSDVSSVVSTCYSFAQRKSLMMAGMFYVDV